MTLHRRGVRPGAPLAPLECFAGWSRDSLKAVSANSTLIDVSPGTVVACAGERSQPFVVVVDGELIVESDGAIDRVLRKGDLWGAESLLGACHAAESLLALTDARLALVQFGEFRHLFHVCPSFAMLVARDLASRVTQPAAS